MNNGMAKLSLGAVLAVSVGFAAAANADEIIVKQKTKTRMCPAHVVVTPARKVTTMRVQQALPVVVNPSAAITTRTTTVESPAAAPVPDETISRRLTIFKERPSGFSSSSTSYETSRDRNPDYAQRIQLMTEQLDKGVRNGWVTSDRAAQLRSELADLQMQEVRVRNNGYLKSDCDDMERRLTGFNISLSHSLEGKMM